MSILPPNIQTRDTLFIKAGVTPGFNVGDNKYVHAITDDSPTFVGWDFTNVTIRSFGPLDPETEFTRSGEIVQLTNTGYSIQANEVWVIEFQPKEVGIPIPSPVIDYSNGYSVAKVLTSLIGRRRWRQPTRSDFPFTLAADLVWGMGDNWSPVFEAEHKIVTPYSVYITQDDKDITQDNFNQYLRNINVDVVLKCLNNVFSKREQLERCLLFERFGRQDYVNINEGKFVGKRIVPAKKFDVSVQIDNIALLFDRDVTFNMYLYHDTQPGSPIHTFPVSAVGGEQTIVDLSYVLSYTGEKNKSGVYYLGYFQDDLGEAQAINEIVSGFNAMYNFGVIPIELNNPSTGVIDTNQVSFTIKTHGFNIQVSAFKDYTQSITQNAHVFDNLIGLQMAADVIELITNNTRTSKDQRITMELTKNLQMDLNLAQTTEDIPFSVGLKTRITREISRVKEIVYPKKKAISVTHDTENIQIYGVPAPPLNDVFKY